MENTLKGFWDLVSTKNLLPHELGTLLAHKPWVLSRAIWSHIGAWSQSKNGYHCIHISKKNMTINRNLHCPIYLHAIVNCHKPAQWWFNTFEGLRTIIWLEKTVSITRPSNRQTTACSYLNFDILFIVDYCMNFYFLNCIKICVISITEFLVRL